MAVLTVQVAGALTTNVSATVVITPGNANYTNFNVLSPTELNFSPGITKRSIEIETKNDSINEDDEVLFVSMVSSNASVRIDKTSGVTVVIIRGNGDKCSRGLHNCGSNAQCISTSGSFICKCNRGFTGNGIICNDINECAVNLSNCGSQATCVNNDGSFSCTCNVGYTGDGVKCCAVNGTVSSTSDCSCDDNTGKLIGAVIAAVLVTIAVMLLIAFFIYRRKWSAMMRSTGFKENFRLHNMFEPEN